MSKRQYPSAEYLRQCFHYENGKLFWLERPLAHFETERGQKVFNKLHAGKEAGGINSILKRWTIGVGKKLYYRYAIVWAMHNGVWPNYLDHKNRLSSDDRIENLRESTASQNNSNRIGYAKSGYKGVYKSILCERWAARISVNKKEVHLGYFATPEEANKAYGEYAQKVYGEFACKE